MNSIFKKNSLFYALVFTILTLLFVTTFMGFKVVDDEGYFLLTTQKIVTRGYNYQDLNVHYGPLYYWITTFFSNFFEISHLTFRSYQFVTYLVIVIVIQFLGRALGISKNVSLISSLFWIISCTFSLCESFHPAWIISSITTLNCLILVKSNQKPQSDYKNYIWLGINTGIIFLLKPHIGLLNLLAITCIFLSRSKNYYKLKIFNFLISLTVFYLITKSLFISPLGVDTIYTASPFIIATAIIFAHTFKGKTSTELDSKGIFYFSLALFAVAIISLIACSVLYEPFVIANSLFYPTNNITFLTGTTRTINSFTLIESILQISLLLGIRHSVLNAKPRLMYLCLTVSVLLLFPFLENNSINLIAIMLIIFYFSFKRSRKSKELGIREELVIILAFNLFHAYPFDMIHLCFITPTLYILLFSFLPIKDFSRSFKSFAISLGLFFIYFKIAWCPTPMGYSSNGHWVPGFYNLELQNETKNISNYIAKNSNTEDKLIIFGSFPTLNILSERDSPGSMISASYKYFPDNIQSKLIQDLQKTKFAVFNLKSKRFEMEIDPENKSKNKRLLYDSVKNSFEEVPSATWNELGKANYLMLLKNKNF